MQITKPNNNIVLWTQNNKWQNNKWPMCPEDEKHYLGIKIVDKKYKKKKLLTR